MRYAWIPTNNEENSPPQNVLLFTCLTRLIGRSGELIISGKKIGDINKWVDIFTFKCKTAYSMAAPVPEYLVWNNKKASQTCVFEAPN